MIGWLFGNNYLLIGHRNLEFMPQKQTLPTTTTRKTKTRQLDKTRRQSSKATQITKFVSITRLLVLWVRGSTLASVVDEDARLSVHSPPPSSSLERGWNDDWHHFHSSSLPVFPIRPFHRRRLRRRRAYLKRWRRRTTTSSSPS